MAENNSPANPLWMAYVPTKIGLRRAFIVTAISITPVALAVLMQNPALRQSLQMKFYHHASMVFHHIGNRAIMIQLYFNQEYQKAKM